MANQRSDFREHSRPPPPSDVGAGRLPAGNIADRRDATERVLATALPVDVGDGLSRSGRIVLAATEQAVPPAGGLTAWRKERPRQAEPTPEQRRGCRGTRRHPQGRTISDSPKRRKCILIPNLFRVVTG